MINIFITSKKLLRVVNYYTNISACAGVRADLKMCLLESDCCKKDMLTPRECLHDNLCPQECQSLRVTFFECKRSLLDNRMRFRGHKGY